MGYIKPLTEHCMVVLCSHISQFDDFPPMVPSGLLEMVFQRLIEKRMISADVLNLFLRSSMQTFNIQKAKISGITINSATSITTLRIDGAPLLQQLCIFLPSLPS
eukprot:Phypoly_transcript_25232.p1 GENE.Phypoly_transcript_25232~~Phypoly_transcript_25232.p1  ORF type:complete len:112 (+),score=12.35 Phypoly_transcript_25232:24-338(+)